MQWMTLNGNGGLFNASAKKVPSPTKAEQRDFFEALGRAIASWQGVETSLYAVASSCVQPRDVSAIAAMFHSQMMFKQRLGSVDAVISRISISKPSKERWEALSKKLEKAARDRNHFAHGQSFFDPTRAKGARLFVSGNYWHHDNWGKVGKSGRITTAQQLKAYTEQFFKLDLELWRYSATLTDDLTPPTNALIKALSFPWGSGEASGGLLNFPLK